ncbi:MAG: hypothetical protein ACOCX1_06095 [Fimbriimonadaceae bacterium]
MKTLALLGISALVLSMSAPVETEHTMLLDGEELGEATLKTEIDDDGRYISRLETEIEIEDFSITDIIEEIYDAEGNPVSTTQTTYFDGDEDEALILEVEFDDDEVTVTQEAFGAEAETDYDIPEDVNLRDETVFWFVRDQPEVGDEFRGHTFNLNAMEEDEIFEEIALRYAGKEEIEWKGETVEAHKLIDLIDGGILWLDDNGHPYRAEFNEEDEEGEETEYELVRQ